MMRETAYSWEFVIGFGVLILLFIIFQVCRDIKRAPTRGQKLKLIKIYLVVVVVGVSLFAGITHYEVGDRFFPQPEFTFEPSL